MTIADQARDSAIPCELVLYAYRKNKDGIVISFVVNPDDMPSELATARIGARYQAALVQIGDDEQPVIRTRKEAMPNKPLSGLDAARPQPDDSKQLAGAKRPWETFEPAQQAGIRSNDIRFVQFLEEEYRDIWREHQDAAECIRSICEVRSRAELGTDQRKRVLWNQLDRHYQAWDAKVRLNA